MSRLDDAIERYREALERVLSQGLGALATLIRLDLARALLDRRSAGDHREAATLLERAGKDAAGIDAAHLLERVAALAVSCV